MYQLRLGIPGDTYIRPRSNLLPEAKLRAVKFDQGLMYVSPGIPSLN